MARIAVVSHHHDEVMHHHGLRRWFKHRYMLAPILRELKRRGHTVTEVRGLNGGTPSADAAVMHVNLTRVPAAYTELGRSFPICLNLRVTDISKRVISGAVIQRDTEWRGPVIVKSNLNSRGYPELRINRQAEEAGEPAPFPLVARSARYQVLENAAAVPPEAWDSDQLVVEKFVPERLKDGFGTRFWTFLGGTERCDLIVAASELVKAANVVRFEPSPVPDKLRELRERIGLDYGKMDFVIHDGEAIVLDVNKTMGMPPSRRRAEWPVRYANGFETYLKRS